MSALTTGRNTPGVGPVIKSGQGKLTVLNAEILYAGGMLAQDYTGEVQMASDTLGLRVIGRCPKGVDNTADGEQSEPAEGGIFRYENDGTYPLSATLHKGAVAYVVDDQTVGSHSTNLVAAGIVHDVDSDGVWVDQRPEALVLARELARLVVVAVTDDTTATAAQCYQGNVLITVSKSSIATVTLPSAAAGYRLRVQRLTASAGYDVAIQAASGDTILGSAAGKKVDNTVDAVSEHLEIVAINATAWVVGRDRPSDYASWAINNA